MRGNELLIIIAVSIAVGLGIGIPAYLAVLLFRKYHAAADAALHAILAECSAAAAPDDPGNIQITFYLYVGFLNTMKTIRIDPIVATPKALELLRRLRNFSFKWGLIGAGSLFVPFITIYHYYKQKRRVLAAMNALAQEGDEPDPVNAARGRE